MGKIDHSSTRTVSSLTATRVGCCALALGAILAGCTARPAESSADLTPSTVPATPSVVPSCSATSSCVAIGSTTADSSPTRGLQDSTFQPIEAT